MFFGGKGTSHSDSYFLPTWSIMVSELLNLQKRMINQNRDNNLKEQIENKSSGRSFSKSFNFTENYVLFSAHLKPLELSNLHKRDDNSKIGITS